MNNLSDWVLWAILWPFSRRPNQAEFFRIRIGPKPKPETSRSERPWTLDELPRGISREGSTRHIVEGFLRMNGMAMMTYPRPL